MIALNRIISTYIKLLLFQHQEVEDTYNRIKAHKGVMGVVIVNQEGLKRVGIISSRIASKLGCCQNEKLQVELCKWNLQYLF